MTQAKAPGIQGTGHLEHIDILRGVAILMVIVVHSAQRVPGLPFAARLLSEFGQMGVQLFFVASAYTLCLAFERRQTEPHPVKSFYLRRLFRIAPLYYLAIGLYFAVALVRDGGTGLSNMPLSNYNAFNITLNVLFLHSLHPAANNTIVPGGWSIATEMMFYAVFPLLYPLVRRAHAGSWLGLPVALVLSGCAAMAWQVCALGSWQVPPLKNSFAYFSLPAQLPVFMIGIATYLWSHNQPVRTGKDGSLPLLALGVPAGIAASLALWTTNWPLAFAIIPTLCATSFACLFVLLARTRAKVGWLIQIGKVSYSMYVFHFVVVWGMNKYLSGIRESLDMSTTLSFVLYVGLASGLTFLMARASERIIERPGIDLGNRIVRAMQRGNRQPTSQGAT